MECRQIDGGIIRCSCNWIPHTCIDYIVEDGVFKILFLILYDGKWEIVQDMELVYLLEGGGEVCSVGGVLDFPGEDEMMEYVGKAYSDVGDIEAALIFG
jgi:hypothetical protein